MTVIAEPRSVAATSPGLLAVQGTGPGRDRGIVQQRATARSPRRPGRTVLRIAVSAAIVAAVFGFALPRFASYRSVWASMGAMTWPQVFLVAAAAAGSMASSWIVICSVLPSVRLREAAVVNLGSSAVANTLPAGGALAMGVSWAMAFGRRRARRQPPPNVPGWLPGFRSRAVTYLPPIPLGALACLIWRHAPALIRVSPRGADPPARSRRVADRVWRSGSAV
jgi:hypothetical protein